MSSERKGKRNKYHRDRRKLPKVKAQERNYRYMRKYGITIKDFEQMVKDQGDKCAICGRESVPLCVDHNHETNKIRGLLCNYCNVGMGLFNDDIVSLLEVIKYLQKYEDDTY